MTPDDAPAPRTWLGRLVQIRPGEGASVAWSTALFFLLLCANFVLRPVREALGIERGADDLPLVWSGTLALALLLQPVFALLLARTRRRTLVPAVYVAGIAMVLLFRGAWDYAPEAARIGVGYGFYVAFSVFNVFMLSVFWAFAADVFRLEQAQRLFAFVSVGGTLGAIAGSTLAKELAEPIGTLNLMFVGCALLGLATACVAVLVRLHPEAAPRERAAEERQPEFARDARPAWSGLAHLLKSPYLQGIAAFTFFHPLFGTVLYFTQANLVADVLTERDERTAYFATVDQITNAVTLVLQLFVTGQLIRRLGTGFALVSQPVAACAACLGLGWMLVHGANAFGAGWSWSWPPALAAVAAAKVLYSATNYATAKPARESLYTVVPRAAKYASKSFIDTFVYRGADVIAAWSFNLVHKTLAVALGPVALGAAPLAIVWLVVGLALGRKQRELGGGGPR